MFICTSLEVEDLTYYQEVIDSPNHSVMKDESFQDKRSSKLFDRWVQTLLLLAPVAHLDFKKFKMDEKTTFLNGNLEEDIYMD